MRALKLADPLGFGRAVSPRKTGRRPQFGPNHLRIGRRTHGALLTFLRLPRSVGWLGLSQTLLARIGRFVQFDAEPCARMADSTTDLGRVFTDAGGKHDSVDAGHNRGQSAISFAARYTK